MAFSFGKENTSASKDSGALGKEDSQTGGLTAFELDALKETANIGTGNASVALSSLFKKKVNITLPKLELSRPSEISKFILGPNEMIVGIYSKVMEGIEGNLLMIMPISSAFEIARAFIGDATQGSQNLSDKDKQVLKKVGTAIYSSYLTSIAKFFEKKIMFSPPNIVSTFGDSVHDFLLLHVGKSDKFIVIKLGFDVDMTRIKGDFMLLFTMESLAPILSNIRKKASI